MEIFQIYNQGDIPAIASGYRSLVAITKTKWVFLLDWTTLEQTKIKKDLFLSMRPKKLDYRPKFVKKTIKELTKHYEGRPTNLVKEILRAA